MNNLFAAKLLQNLRNKKGNKGFTLIELLVVVIIIGVLAAVALPNLLGQVAKGRQAEAKNNLGAVNRAQKAYRLETAFFGLIDDTTTAGTDEGTLAVEITGTYYDYTNGATDNVAAIQYATSLAAYENDIRDYSATVNQQDDGDFVAIICETTAVDGNTAPTAVAPTIGTLTADPACNVATTQIK